MAGQTADCLIRITAQRSPIPTMLTGFVRRRRSPAETCNATRLYTECKSNRQRNCINYPDVTHGNQLSVGPFAINDEGDFLISFSVGAHIIFGGHLSVAFNVTEYFERLLD